MGLKPCCLHRKNGICSTVRAVETVTRKLGHNFKYLICLDRWHSFLRSPFHKNLAVLLHFICLLLTHCPAKHICSTETIACHDLGTLHDLLLVDHDTIRWLEKVCKPFMRIIHRFSSVLSIDEHRYITHRSRAIERVHGDEVFNIVGYEFA